jgi:hypothetical protein
LDTQKELGKRKLVRSQNSESILASAMEVGEDNELLPKD